MSLHRWAAVGMALALAASPGGHAAAQTQASPAQAAPVADLTGRWTFTQEGHQPVVIVLKQVGSVLTGEMPVSAGFPTRILFSGVIEGAQMDIMALFPYEGGELVHIRAEYKDGRLVGRAASIHSSPRKWSHDADRAAVGVR